MRKLSREYSAVSGRAVAANRIARKDVKFFDQGDIKRLSKAQLGKQIYRRLKTMSDMGLIRGFVDEEGFTSVFDEFVSVYGAQRVFMDALQPALTTPSIATPVQWLQEWAPGIVYDLTAAREADELFGVNIVGKWSDEQIVQAFVERLGVIQVYGDDTNPPNADWNPQYNVRTIVRFEGAVKTGPLELARAAEVRMDSAGMKRLAVEREMLIRLNQIAFTGFNNGQNQTYGALNDPNLNAYQTVPVGATGHTFWYTKTTLEILADIQFFERTLLQQSLSNIKPEKIAITLGLPTDVVTYLKTITVQGISVIDQIRKWYPKLRIISAPEFENASGGLNAAYFYAEQLGTEENDDSTDGGAVIPQMVQSKFQVLGVQKLAKGTLEAYACATAGIFAKRPLGLTRFLGV